MTAAGREELRRDLVARIPVGYSPRAHLLIPSLLGILAIGGALSMLRDVAAWQIGFVPLFFVLGNAIEWHAHRGLLHRHVRALSSFYRAHSQHHAVYTAADMAIRNPRELKLVLLPTFGVVCVAAATLLMGVAAFLLGLENLSALWVATSVAYVMAYEWLHLLYHLPADGWLAGLPSVEALRRLHALHHGLPLMQRWNLNVTLPLWDWVRGTLYRPGHAPLPARHGAP
jgi:hypothetical protein